MMYIAWHAHALRGIHIPVPEESGLVDMRWQDAVVGGLNRLDLVEVKMTVTVKVPG